MKHVKEVLLNKSSYELSKNTKLKKKKLSKRNNNDDNKK